MRKVLFLATSLRGGMAQKGRSHTCCLQMIFCEDTEDQMAYLSWILAWFEAMSRLSINLDKSSLIPVGRVENVKNLAIELGCKIGYLPAEYLGLPLGAKRNASSV